MMADVPIPATLEQPPRTTGNAQQDFPLIVDWMFRAYLVIQQAVNYINAQITQETPDLQNLPDPATATIFSAQSTANTAYSLANEQKTRIDGFVAGEFVIDETNSSASINFDNEQPDTEYRVWVQAKSVTGTPDPDAFIIRTKTYTESGFSVTLLADPGAGTAITFEWQLIRNT